MDCKVLDSSDFYKFRFQFCMVLSVVVVVFCFLCVGGWGVWVGGVYVLTVAMFVIRDRFVKIILKKKEKTYA